MKSSSRFTTKQGLGAKKREREKREIQRQSQRQRLLRLKLKMQEMNHGPGSHVIYIIYRTYTNPAYRSKRKGKRKSHRHFRLYRLT